MKPVLDVIRCDLPTYLVWKWSPSQGDKSRQNTIRWGSSLRVKDGEMAVFVYSNKEGGSNQDFIAGPFDSILKTANLPVLSSLLGLAYGGDSPFQAEVYFINLASNVQLLFGVPYFDVFDPRYPDLPISVAARGTLTFNITDYQNFIKCNRLIEFNLDDFKAQIRSLVTKYLKSIIINTPRKIGIPAIQIESQLLEINDQVDAYIKNRLSEFGVNMKAFDLEAIEINKDTDNYRELKTVTNDIKRDTALAQADINIKNLADLQQMNVENMEATLAAQREEMQHAQRMQTDSRFFNVHSLNTQADVMMAAADAMGQMGANNTIGGDGSGFNPAGMMTGMMMGGALGQQMAGMMGQMGQTINQSFQQNTQAPPPIPQVTYFVLIGGQQTGPYPIPTLAQMAATAQLLPDTYVWKQGMAQWDLAKNTELAQLFAQAQPPVPPTPPIPPTL